jgi:type IV pilus assembly protein PilE
VAGNVRIARRDAAVITPAATAGKKHFAGPGFSLVEMLAVLAIVATLLLVALPGYQHIVVKSSRAAARHSLLDLVARQEQFFVNNKRYAAALEELDLPALYYIDAQGEAVSQSAAMYRVELELADGGYRGVRATPLNRQATDLDCRAFSLSRIGLRSVSGRFAATPERCW